MLNKSMRVTRLNLGLLLAFMDGKLLSKIAFLKTDIVMRKSLSREWLGSFGSSSVVVRIALKTNSEIL